MPDDVRNMRLLGTVHRNSSIVDACEDERFGRMPRVPDVEANMGDGRKFDSPEKEIRNLVEA